MHVTYADALAHRSWAGKRLPTEVEWERAARGGMEGAEFAWGDEIAPNGEERMNRWIGEFPWRYDGGPAGSAPNTVAVRSFPRNGFGLYEVTGNVWEWTSTPYAPGHSRARPCCGPAAASGIPQLTLKGGSFLCAENYCSRFRPAARIPEPVDTSTCHVSFRCALSRRPDEP